MTSVFRAVARRGRLQLAASDPGLVRLGMGLRATLATAATAGLLHLAGGLHDFSLSCLLVGSFMAMMTIVLVDVPGAREQRLVTAVSLAPGLLGLVLAAAVADRPWLSYPVFLAVIFACFYVQRFGTRWKAWGMTAYMAFFIVLYLAPKLAELPWEMLAMTAGVAIAYGVRFGLLDDRDPWILWHSSRALQARVGLCLIDLTRTLHRPSAELGQRLERDLLRINEATLIVDDHLVGAAAVATAPWRDELRFRLQRLELGMEALARLLERLAQQGVLHAELRATVLAQLYRMLRQLRGGATGSFSMPLLLEREVDRLKGFNRELTELVQLLGERDWSLDQSLNQTAASPPVPGKRADKRSLNVPGGLRTPDWRLLPSTVHAIQATFACALAMYFGHLVSPLRWQWAVVTSFVVYSGATTRSDTVVRAWQRTLGTAFGVLAGMCLPLLVADLPNLQMVLMFLCMFLSFYAQRLSYALMVLFLTAMIALLYQMLGSYSTSLLLLRFEETVVGTVIGAAVGAWVFPSSGSGKARLAGADALTGLALMLRHTGKAAGLIGGDSHLLPQLRDLDHKVQELRTTAKTLTKGLLSPFTREMTGLIEAIYSMTFLVRQLFFQHVLDGKALSPKGASTALALAERLEMASVRLRASAAQLPEPEPGPAQAPFDEASCGDVLLSRLSVLLSRFERALDR